MSDKYDHQKAEADRLWEKIQAETELTPEQQNATEAEKQIWQHQVHDPAHVYGNSHAAEEKLAKHAQETDLSQHSMPAMSPEERDAVMKEIAKNMADLDHEIEQSQGLKKTPEQEH